jgi:hypothetical protein
MAELGGVGSFAQGFATSFTRGREQRRLRDQLAQQREQFERREKRAERGEARDERRLDLQEQTAEALQTYRQGQQELQKRQLLLNQRQADLTIAEKMMQLADPKTPKPVRQYMLGKLGPMLGIPAGSQEFKDFSKMMSGLDDDTLSGVRASIAAILPDAQPGQIAAFAKSVLAGQMDIGQVVQLGKQAQERRAVEQKQRGRASAFGPAPLSRGNLFSPVPLERQQPTRAKTSEELRQSAVQLFRSGDMEGGNAALSQARAMEADPGREVNIIEQIRRKIASGQALTEGEQRVYDDALNADPLARFLRDRGLEQGSAGGEVTPRAAPPAARPAPPSQSEAAEPLPEGVTEEDIQFTMKKHGLTREQVLERLGNGP